MGIHPRLPGLTADREPGEAIPTALIADDSSSRRAFLTKIAVGGAALTIGSQLVPATRLLPVSGAQEGEDEVTLDADETQARFLASVALAANQAYRAAAVLDGVSLPEPVVEIVESFGRHHSQQAASLVTLLPESVTVDTIPADPTFLAEQTAALEGAGTPDEVLGVLRSLEETVAATQFAAIGTLESQDDARLVSTLLPVCAQHATVLGIHGGEAPAAVLPEGQSAEGALNAIDDPVGEGPGEAATDGGDSSATTEG